MKFFNTGGPCNPEYHYMLPATERLEPFNVDRLIRQQSYFVVHAPRQVGKTTAMLALAQELTASGEYTAVMLSMEVGSPYSADLVMAEQLILNEWRDQIRFQLPSELVVNPEDFALSMGGAIGSFLSEWAFRSERPLVIFLDEIDALRGEVLLSVLRQLRSGYYRRPQGFPSSLALIGLRDVRDYKIASGGSDRLHSPSPFNIAVSSIMLRNFTEDEVITLLTQHVNETGQIITDEAMSRVFSLSNGQPWLVNALAKVCVEELEQNLDKPILLAHVDQAKEILIQRRQVHLDQLTDKLREPRVRSVIEPILAGGALGNIPLDDIDYVCDLGLVERLNGGGVSIANPIYKEIIPRILAANTQASLPRISPSWLNEDGSLNPDNLLDAFLAFWRQHGQPLLKNASYHEIAPHLVMMAFLHRVINGNGIIDREYAIGSGKMDLYVRYAETQLAMELKVWRDGRPDPLTMGLQQLDEYMDGLSYNGQPVEIGWLVIFDQRSDLPDISERTTTEVATSPAGRKVTVVRG